ncbi:MAG TPA: carboxypeptidase-like regulatory domain-containing protein, partial [Blastocatellia bacterium]
MKKLFFSRLVLLSLIVMLVAQAVPAQVTTSGRLAGVVTDAQGALIPKAQIVAVNDQTRGEYKTVANDEGSWNLPSLSIGSYTVTITAQGF